MIGLPIFLMVFGMMFALISGLRSEPAMALAPEWATAERTAVEPAPAGGSD